VKYIFQGLWIKFWQVYVLGHPVDNRSNWEIYTMYFYLSTDRG